MSASPTDDPPLTTLPPVGPPPRRGLLCALRDKPAAALACWGLIALLGLLLLLPVGLALVRGFLHRGQPSLYWFGRLLHDDTLRFIRNGLVLASLTTLLCLAIAVPLALLRARCRFRGQGLLSVAVLVPLILPPFVGAMAMKHILGRFGALNLLLARLGVLDPNMLTWPDWMAGQLVVLAILQALHLFPILYLNAAAALANVDPAYSQAARNLGAGPLRTFWSVTLPLMRPGLFAGGTIVFIWAFTDIGTPVMLQYKPLLPVRIFDDLQTTDYGGKTFAMVFTLLALSVLFYVVGRFVFGRSPGAASSKATVQTEIRRLGPLGTLAAWSAFGLVLLVAVLPHVGVVLIALAERWGNTVLPEAYTVRYLHAVVRDSETYTSIVNSLKYAGCSTVLNVLLGTLAAWLIVRSRAVGSRLLDALAMLPLAVPGLILAAGYVALTVPGSWLEDIGPGANPFAILVLAYTARRMPFIVRGVSGGLQQAPESLEEAARNLGASRTRTALRITLPLIAANLIAGAVLVFAFAMLEVSDSLVLAQLPEHYPITKQIYSLAKAGSPDAESLAAALGVYGMALLGGTMALASLLLGRRLGTVFRA